MTENNNAAGPLSSGTVHFVSLKEVARLEEIFAVMTPQGWKIPVWLVHMKETARKEV